MTNEYVSKMHNRETVSVFIMRDLVGGYWDGELHIVSANEVSHSRWPAKLAGYAGPNWPGMWTGHIMCRSWGPKINVTVMSHVTVDSANPD